MRSSNLAARDFPKALAQRLQSINAMERGPLIHFSGCSAEMAHRRADLLTAEG
jgi:hypothetical protein